MERGNNLTLHPLKQQIKEVLACQVFVNPDTTPVLPSLLSSSLSFQSEFLLHRYEY